MFLINNKRISSSMKQKLFFCFMFFCNCICFCQSLKDKEISIKIIQEKTIQFYAEQNTLCYTFEETRNGNLYPARLVSRGDVKSYREGAEVFYRGTERYDTIILKTHIFETVKNPSYFGVNHYQENYYADYKVLPEKKRYYTFKNTPDKILKPDTSLKKVFSDSCFHKRLTETKELYRLELRDTNKYERKLDGYTTEKIKVFYLSKKDYRIVKYSEQFFWTTGDLHNSDSVVRVYTYYHDPLKKIKRDVNSFTPLTGKKYIPPLPPRDTVSVFPEFHLPDSSGKLRKPDAPYMLVDFWYKACGPCLVNMKYLDKLKYKDIEIITINIRDTLDGDVRKIMSKHDFTFLFNGNKIAEALHVTAYPTMYLIDRNRNILYKHIGFGGSEELTELLNKLSPEN